jgi:hypothetical protein
VTRTVRAAARVTSINHGRYQSLKTNLCERVISVAARKADGVPNGGGFEPQFLGVTVQAPSQ